MTPPRPGAAPAAKPASKLSDWLGTVLFLSGALLAWRTAGTLPHMDMRGGNTVSPALGGAFVGALVGYLLWRRIREHVLLAIRGDGRHERWRLWPIAIGAALMSPIAIGALVWSEYGAPGSVWMRITAALCGAVSAFAMVCGYPWMDAVARVNREAAPAKPGALMPTRPVSQKELLARIWRETPSAQRVVMLVIVALGIAMFASGVALTMNLSANMPGLVAINAIHTATIATGLSFGGMFVAFAAGSWWMALWQHAGASRLESMTDSELLDELNSKLIERHTAEQLADYYLGERGQRDRRLYRNGVWPGVGIILVALGLLGWGFWDLADWGVALSWTQALTAVEMLSMLAIGSAMIASSRAMLRRSRTVAGRLDRMTRCAPTAATSGTFPVVERE